MGRRRNRANRMLPKGVYANRRGYVYRPYLGVSDGRPRFGAEVLLAPPGASLAQVLIALEGMRTRDRQDLDWLLAEYHQSPAFHALHTTTREEYERYASILAGYPTRSGRLGEAALATITKRTIRAYLDSYKQGQAPVSANRHIQYLKAAWNWAEQRLAIPGNPCEGVTLNAEAPRVRYVSQQEFFAAKSLAKGYLPVAMELAYLCRARRGEVFSLTVHDILPEGLRVLRSKGSRGEITAWTPRLRQAVEDARALYPDAPTPPEGPYLLHDKRGRPYRKNALDSAWQRLMARYVDAGGERFTFHDLKSAGYSDQVEQYAGHKSDRMHRVYDRKLRVVQPPGGMSA